MKDLQRLKEARYIHPINIHFLREISDDTITIHCDTRTFKVWGQVEDNEKYLIPKERKLLNVTEIDSKYLIHCDYIYEFLSSIYRLTGFTGVRKLVCYNLEPQNKKTFWCLKYIHFLRYKKDPNYFICFDRAYNLLNYNLVNQHNIDILASWILLG